MDSLPRWWSRARHEFSCYKPAVLMAACPLCRSRKGKRACPALRTAICSACCGEKRIVEVACPADCVYLTSGTQNDVRREAEDYLQHQDPRKSLQWLKTVEGLGFLLEAIERTVAAAPLPSLADPELLLALESARKTFDAESKGVIYEDLPTSPSLQALTRDLIASVRSLRKLFQERMDADRAAGRGSLPVWGPAEAAHCLAVIAERCEYHIRRRDEAGSLVAHLRRIHPPGRDEGGPSGSPRIVLA